MQQKVLLICKIYIFCIYFSLNNLTIQKKVGNPVKINKTLPQKFRGIPAKLLRKKTCLGFGLSFKYIYMNEVWILPFKKILNERSAWLPWIISFLTQISFWLLFWQSHIKLFELWTYPAVKVLEPCGMLPAHCQVLVQDLARLLHFKLLHPVGKRSGSNWHLDEAESHLMREHHFNRPSP